MLSKSFKGKPDRLTESPPWTLLFRATSATVLREATFFMTDKTSLRKEKLKERDLLSVEEVVLAEKKITSLYLVPTLYHDLISNKTFSTSLIKTVEKIGFAGASMNQNLLEKLDYYFKPKVFINHYGSTEKLLTRL